VKKSAKGTNNGYRVGVHTSITGGVSQAVERAAALNCSTMQIFSHNPRQWYKRVIPEEEIERFVSLRKKYDINPVYIHSSYLINLASDSAEVLSKSIDLLSYELSTADALGVDYVVIHTGSSGSDSGEKARGRAVEAIMKAINTGNFRSSILLENTAGKKGDITSSIQDLAEIIDICNCDRLAGICIDTCHAFSSNYNLASDVGLTRLIREIRKHIGLDKLRLIHLNDSKRPFGSGIDRHEHIGKGFIGLNGFKNILSHKRLSKVPMILETPKKNADDDKNNLKKVFRLLSA
jgi:deoxyribonuclease-4